MPEDIRWQLLWVASGLIIVVSAVLAKKSRRAMYVGRSATALLFLVGGALFNALNLATGGNYADFADASYIPFVRETWRSLVAPNAVIFISLLVAFEAIVGLLTASGGRRTQLGLVGAIGFHVALMTFGWAFVPWPVVMIPAFALLLRAERTRAAAVKRTLAEAPGEHRFAA